MWSNIRKGIIIAIAFTVLMWAWKQLAKGGDTKELIDKFKNLTDEKNQIYN